MENLFKRRVLRQFVKFGMVGASSTAIDWGTFFILEKFSIYYLLAKIIAFLLAVINSYIWNRKWTFRSKDIDKTKEFIRFLITSAIGLSVNTFIFYLAVSKLRWSYLQSLILATMIVLIWNLHLTTNDILVINM